MSGGRAIVSSTPPRDVVSLIGDLVTAGVRLVMVRRMPPGLRWCIDNNTIYMQAEPPWSQANLDLREAISHIAPPRPQRHLVALDGGMLDSPTVPMQAPGRF